MKKGILADLFAGNFNKHWDLGRVLSFLSMIPLFASAGWNIWLGQPIDALALGGGIAAVLTASAALIAAKDFAQTRAISQVTQDATANVQATEPNEVIVVNRPDEPVPVENA